MQQLHTTQSAPSGGSDVGWLCHVVRPLLRRAGAQRPPTARGAGSHAVLHRPAYRRAYTGGCFAGDEGAGCELSLDEQRIAMWVGSEPASWEV